MTRPRYLIAGNLVEVPDDPIPEFTLDGRIRCLTCREPGPQLSAFEVLRAKSDRLIYQCPTHREDPTL